MATVSDPLLIYIFGQTSAFNSGNISTFGYHDFSGLEPDAITNHTQRSLNLLIEQFERLENIDKYESSLLVPYQDLEYLFQDMRSILDIETATGDRLDIIGEIVGEPRNFRVDDDYREAIKVRIFINTSNGEPEVIRSVTISLTNATSVRITEMDFAEIYIEINTAFSLPENLRNFIESVAPAGVKINFLLVNDTDPDFAFDGEGGYPAPDNTLGFGETGAGNELEGGRYVELLDI